MTNQITLQRALELVEFELSPEGWRVKHVKGSVYGNVLGKVRGDVGGDVGGDVRGTISGNVYGNVWGDFLGNVRGTINGRQWKFIEPPKKEFNQPEDSNG